MKNISSFEKTIVYSLDHHDMLSPGETVLVAVSGGRDSIALMHALLALRARLQITIIIGHFNHGLRAQFADRDQRFVEGCAKKRGLRCVCGFEDVGARAKRDSLSIEEAARNARYDFFAALKKSEGIDALATGHTLDDQAETVLMRILKGSGLTGISGIRPVFDYAGLRIIRPFIDVTGADIDTYVKTRALKHIEDETNRDERFLRNKIRKKLVPFLEQEINPQVKQALARFASSAHSDTDFLKGQALGLYRSVVHTRAQDVIVLNKTKFARLHESLQFRIFSLVLAELKAERELTFRHWQTFKHDLSREKRSSFMIGADLQIHQQYDEIIISRMTKALDRVSEFLDHGQSISIPSHGITVKARLVRPEQVRFSARSRSEYFDSSKITFPLIIRSREDGDALIPLGMKGKKKVKDILIDKKVPAYTRPKALIVLSGDRILWVIPHCISNFAKITAKTKSVLRLSVHPLKA
jgi:tRNA(Ile)-lysidine synthase